MSKTSMIPALMELMCFQHRVRWSNEMVKQNGIILSSSRLILREVHYNASAFWRMNAIRHTDILLSIADNKLPPNE